MPIPTMGADLALNCLSSLSHRVSGLQNRNVFGRRTGLKTPLFISIVFREDYHRTPWRPGTTTTGSTKVYVVEGSLANPTHVWDHTFGQATLSKLRLSQFQNDVLKGANVPIPMVKP